MAKAVLVDLRKCMGCRGCQVACKAWNDNSGEVTHNTGTYENPPDLSGNTWTVVKFKEDDGAWFFSKWQCMHCLNPSCVSVCPSGALYKTEQGPVLYNVNRCIGCQYCRTACPFAIPRFDWEKRMVTKCTFCVDRITNDLEPACVKTCPPAALSFDDRETVITQANQARAGGAYLYGMDEAGGTSWIYISDVPLDERGFPTVGPIPYTSISWGILGSQLATIAVGAAAIGLYSLYLRKKKLEEQGGK